MKQITVYGPIEMGSQESKRWCFSLLERLKRAWASFCQQDAQHIHDLDDILLNSGRADFKLHINNVDPDGSIDMWISPDPGVAAIQNPVHFSLKNGRIE